MQQGTILWRPEYCCGRGIKTDSLSTSVRDKANNVASNRGLESKASVSLVICRRVSIFSICWEIKTYHVGWSVIHTCFHNLQGFPSIITSIDYTHYVTLSPCLACHPMPARNVSYSQSKPRSTDLLCQHPPLQAGSHSANDEQID
jgi:hypothetical protein